MPFVGFTPHLHGYRADRQIPVFGSALFVDQYTDPYYSNDVYGLGNGNNNKKFAWVVPNDVYNISAFVIGGGGGGQLDIYSSGGLGNPGGGGGGGSAWIRKMAVTPGETLYITAGWRGQGGISTGSNGRKLPPRYYNGGTSSISRNAYWNYNDNWTPNTLLMATGGEGRWYSATSTTIAGGSGWVSGSYLQTGTFLVDYAYLTGGGSRTAGSGYAAGGGGAAGYTGGGTRSGIRAIGDAGGGGGGYESTGNTGTGGWGGGVWPYGANTLNDQKSAGPYGGWGFQGSPATVDTQSYIFGGGAPGRQTTTSGAQLGPYGGWGCVRIIWGPGRGYPSTNTGIVGTEVTYS